MGFLRHAKPASWGGENGSRRGKTDPEGSKVGDLLYTGMVPDAKTEIPAYRRVAPGQVQSDPAALLSSSRIQTCVRPKIEIPINPRTSSFFPSALIVNRHL